jgi:sterol 3beta-glucosyltransferase
MIAGLPTIIKPFFGDQYFYADRVATLGIGSAVRDMTVEHLAAAITLAVTDEKQIARAKLAGETIRKEDGVGKAIECIYRDLEYSKSLLPPPPPPPPPPPIKDSKLAEAEEETILPRFERRSTEVTVSGTRHDRGREGEESRDDLSSDESSSWDILSARGSERLGSMMKEEDLARSSGCLK